MIFAQGARFKIRIRHFIFASVLVLFVAVCMGWHYLQEPTTLPIKHVKITGYYPHADREKIKILIAPLVSKGLFSVNLEDVKKSLLSLPWIDHAIVTRVWPDEINIDLSEKVPVARFGTEGLITEEGIIFYPALSTISPQLPLFIVPEDKALMALKMYQEFSEILQPLDLHIRELRLTSTLSWEMQLTNGTWIKLGDQDVALRLQRFVRVYPKIFGDKAAVSVDLRYPHGLAVKWQ